MDRRNKNKTNSGKELRIGGSHHHSEPQSSELVIQIKNHLEGGLTDNSGRSWSIYRVPNDLCQIYKNAFLPKMISIGPFHYRNKEDRLQLQVMEEHKKRFLFRLLGGKFKRVGRVGHVWTTTGGGRLLGGKTKRGRRGGDGRTMTDDNEREEDNYSGQKADFSRLDEIVKAMQALEQETRACYSESFDEISSDCFVEMMVVDGCFVVELLRLYTKHKSTKEANADDPIFTTPWMLRTLQRDLLMLENQLPLFVLEKLYVLINNINQKDDVGFLRGRATLMDQAITFFNPLLPGQDAARRCRELSANKPYCHLLHVFYSTFLQSVRKKLDSKGRNRDKLPQNSNSSVSALVRERQLIHRVLELQEVGVQFQKREGQDLLDINFAGDTLGIPPLSIDDNTVPLFFNFIAYEQLDYEAKPYFTNYFMLLDSLVDNAEDIDILHKHGIINHALGSNEDVANLLNKLCRELIYDLDWCYLHNEIKEVNNFCKPYDESQCHLWWRKLIREHFSSPWTCLSLFAAILLLLLTVLSTLYTVYTYYRPSH